MGWLVQTVGVVLVILTLADIYLTVLYPRSGKGVLSMPLSKVVWSLFRLASRIPLFNKNRLLSYCGATLLVAFVTLWILLIVAGFALIAWPKLGSAITNSQGPTETNFVTAFYYSGYSFTTLGVGKITPNTGLYQVLIILEAAIGFSTFTLALTYFLSVYSALTRRNTFALSLQHRTASTANAAEIIARLGANGDFNGARQDITNMSKDLLNLLESHHSYPVLHYFRFQEAYYALAQIALITMDTATLLRSALNEEKYRSLVYSAAVAELEDGGQHMLVELSNSFLPKGCLRSKGQPEAMLREWYYRAVERLRAEGIETVTDLETGANFYITLRRKWEPYVIAFAEHMAYEWSEIAPAESSADLNRFQFRGFRRK